MKENALDGVFIHKAETINKNIQALTAQAKELGSTRDHFKSQEAQMTPSGIDRDGPLFRIGTAFANLEMVPTEPSSAFVNLGGSRSNPVGS